MVLLDKTIPNWASRIPFSLGALKRGLSRTFRRTKRSSLCPNLFGFPTRGLLARNPSFPKRDTILLTVLIGL